MTEGLRYDARMTAQTRSRSRVVRAATTYRLMEPDAPPVNDAPQEAEMSNQWAGPLTFEGVMTGDGRLIEVDALTWADDMQANPAPLRFVTEDVGAHDGAVTVGHIFSIERLTLDEANERLAAQGRPALDYEGDVRVIWGAGDFDFVTDAGREAARQVTEDLTDGVSVDLDDVAFEVRVRAELVEESDAMLEAMLNDDDTDYEAPERRRVGDHVVVAEIQPDDEIMVTTSAGIRAATLVATPAFADARLSLTAAGEPATGAIVALLPADDDPIVAASSQLAHVTMVYLGDAADLTDEQVTQIRDYVADIARGASDEMTAVPESRGELGEEGADVVFLRSDGLTELHDSLVSENGPITDASEFDFNPHITLGYPDEPAEADYDPDEHDEVRFDRLAVWIGEDRTEFPLANDDSEAEPEDAGEADSITAAAAPIAPPREWFADPQLSGPTPIVVTDDGRIYGHLASWNVCHIAQPAGPGTCVVAPHSAMGYSRFHLGSVVLADGETISAGKITMGTGHAGPRANPAQTLAHYDNTGAAVADVRAGEDAHGIWVAGAIRPNATEEQIRALRASPLSGDWRRVDGNLELHAALAVNVPGFPVVPRPAGLVASGELTSLVASGLVVEQATVESAERHEVSYGALSADDIAYLQRLANREREAERETLRAGVRAFANERRVRDFAATRRALQEV